MAPYESVLPIVELANLGDARNEKGRLRHEANLLSVSGVNGDYAGRRDPPKAKALATLPRALPVQG